MESLSFIGEYVRIQGTITYIHFVLQILFGNLEYFPKFVLAFQKEGLITEWFAQWKNKIYYTKA